MKRPIATGLVLVAAGAAAVPAAAGTATVKLRDDYFAPKSKTVSKGSKVRFVWAGKSPHNVSVATGPTRFRSSTKRSGSYTRKFSKKGTYRLVCTIHPGMDMKLRVR